MPAERIGEVNSDVTISADAVQIINLSSDNVNIGYIGPGGHAFSEGVAFRICHGFVDVDTNTYEALLNIEAANLLDQVLQLHSLK